MFSILITEMFRSGVKTEAIDAFCWIHATYPLEPGLIEKLREGFI